MWYRQTLQPLWNTSLAASLSETSQIFARIIQTDIISLCVTVRFDLTRWGRVTHICVVNLTNIDSDNGLSPGRRQAVIWTYVGILLIGPLGTNFSEIFIEILTFSLKKMRLKISSAKWRLFCLGLNVLTLLALGRNIPVEQSQYQGCWWPGSLCRQVISSHDIDWPCSINGSLFSTRKDFNCRSSFEKR